MAHDADNDFPLPPLHLLLSLNTGPEKDGEPMWSIHHPVSNMYFQIDWPSFECLTRYRHYKSAQDLLIAVNNETTLSITIDDIKKLVVFLYQNELLDNSNMPFVVKNNHQSAGFFRKLLKNYLFFTIPLLRPQQFLEDVFPKISFLFGGFFIKAMLSFLVIMIIVAIPRADEFFHTFSNLFSPEGLIQIGIVFFFIKIIHEFAHAFTAVKYGVRVPHMGVAFMILYPVLYTETTGAWQLSSRQQRSHIAIAGIVAELCLAGIFLALWHVVPTGSAIQTICFLVVTVSLVGSLLINLNPLMRFDGYYILSDIAGYDNLQLRSCAFARWRLRQFLFGILEDKPETITVNRERFLIYFGFALIVYRFFLFMGIALLVYHVFFQPLGFFLMMVEIVVFILIPIWNELKIWYKMRDRIIRSRRGKFTAAFLFIIILYCILPIQSRVTLPAVMHATQYHEIFSPVSAQIQKLHVKVGDRVEQGQDLVTLFSPELDKKIKIARLEFEKLEALLRRNQAVLGMDIGSKIVTQDVILQAQLKLKSLEQQRDNLSIKADFSGIIQDMSSYISQGQFVNPKERLFVLVNNDSVTITAYADELQRDRIDAKDSAVFYPKSELLSHYNFYVDRVSGEAVTSVRWRELMSVFGGVIPSDRSLKEGNNPVARRGLYQIDFTQTDSSQIPKNEMVRVGYVHIEGRRISILSSFINKLWVLLRKEAILN